MLRALIDADNPRYSPGAGSTDARKSEGGRSTTDNGSCGSQSANRWLINRRQTTDVQHTRQVLNIFLYSAFAGCLLSRAHSVVIVIGGL